MMLSGKQGGENRFDRISSLPDELAGHILSFLPIKCAVNTSILSTRWRYLFTLTTNRLYFDDLPFLVTAPKISFKEFVYKFLQLHQMSPIKTFSLRCGGSYDISDLNEWVSNAVQKGVQELHYEVDEKNRLLPDGVVACETLVRLELKGSKYYAMKIPISVSLPKLKILRLDTVRFSDQFSLERLISSSKLLEELSLNSCTSSSYGNSNVTISTQLLKKLRIEKCIFEDDIEINAANLMDFAYSGCNVGVKIVTPRKWKCSSFL